MMDPQAERGPGPPNGPTRFEGGLAPDVDWIGAWFDALYHHDDRGRITTRRDPSGAAAPRFHLGRSAHGSVWRIRADVPAAVARRLSRLAAREPTPAGAPPWPGAERAEALRRALDDVAPAGAASPALLWRSREGAVADARLAARADESERLDPLDAADGEALRAVLPDLPSGSGARGPVFVSRSAGAVAAACVLVAGDAGGLAVPRVGTAPAQRRRGHALRAAAGWIRAVRAGGGTPVCRIDPADEAARGLARALALEPFAESLAWA